MRIAFPHMGNACIPLRALVEELGAEAVVPERPNAETLRRGIRHAPEFVCLPFKVTLGDCLNALDQGADTLAMVCGMWACRFGNYGRLQHLILRDLGYRFRSLLIGREDMKAALEVFVAGLGRRFYARIPGALAIFRAKASAVEEIERWARWMRPRDTRPGRADEVMSRYLGLLDEAGSVRGVWELRRRFREEAGSLPAGEEEVLRVKLVGELYVLLEPALNFDLVGRLGRQWRVEARPVLSTYRWLLGPLWLDPRIQLSGWRARRRARPYLPYVLGGEEHMTLSGVLNAPGEGCDGVIHAYPLTCMPENICRTIIPGLAEGARLPYLDLCFDEHTSEAGVETRLEAFVDLMRARREKRALRKDKSRTSPPARFSGASTAPPVSVAACSGGGRGA